MTVHAPHWLVSQPTFVPVSPRVSRRKWTSSRRGSTSAVCVAPLTERETGCFMRTSDGCRKSEAFNCTRTTRARTYSRSGRLSMLLNRFLAHCFPQGCSRQDTRGIERRQRRVGVADEQRDLCAPEHHGIHPTALTVGDDLAEVRPRRSVEPPINELVENQGVDPGARIGGRYLPLDAL